MTTNQDRIRWLESRLRDLEKSVIRAKRQADYISYLETLKAGMPPIMVDEVEWEVMLPNEKKSFLIPYYHIVRAEWLEMRKGQERNSSMQKVHQWLESPWVRVTIAIGTLAEVANLLLHSFLTGGHFLNAVDEISADPILEKPNSEP